MDCRLKLLKPVAITYLDNQPPVGLLCRLNLYNIPLWVSLRRSFRELDGTTCDSGNAVNCGGDKLNNFAGVVVEPDKRPRGEQVVKDRRGLTIR